GFHLAPGIEQRLEVLTRLDGADVQDVRAGTPGQLKALRGKIFARNPGIDGLDSLRREAEHTNRVLARVFRDGDQPVGSTPDVLRKPEVRAHVGSGMEFGRKPA